MRRWLLCSVLVGAFLLGAVLGPAQLLAQSGGPASAAIQLALRRFLATANTWTATQTFTNVVINGTCTGTGCGGGGGGTPAGATNTVQYNAGAGNFGAVALNATATPMYLQQISSGVAAFAQVAATDLSGTVANTQGGTGQDSAAWSALVKVTAGVWAPYTGTSCTNQAVTALSALGAATCTTLTSAYVNNTIALTGTDIDTANQVTATHLASPLPSAQGGTANGFFTVSGPTTSAKTFTFPNAAATVLTDNAVVSVSQGGTGLASGTSGGVPYFSSTTAITSSALLTANQLLQGGGAGTAPSTAVVARRVTADVPMTTNTVLTNVSDLTFTVVAGTHYTFSANLLTTPDVTGGWKVQMGGTATMTDFAEEIAAVNNGSAFVVTGVSTAFNSTGLGGAGATSVWITITGAFTVNTGGSFTVQFAQNTSSGTSTLLKNSSVTVLPSAN